MFPSSPRCRARRARSASTRWPSSKSGKRSRCSGPGSPDDPTSFVRRNAGVIFVGEAISRVNANHGRYLFVGPPGPEPHAAVQLSDSAYTKT